MYIAAKNDLTGKRLLKYQISPRLWYEIYIRCAAAERYIPITMNKDFRRIICFYYDEIDDAGYTERQGCQMVSFLTKNTNLGIFWRILDCKIREYSMVDLEYITNIFSKFYGIW
jgi:hypothetical protein